MSDDDLEFARYSSELTDALYRVNVAITEKTRLRLLSEWCNERTELGKWRTRLIEADRSPQHLYQPIQSVDARTEFDEYMRAGLTTTEGGAA